jgi:glycosyltransferase involved in cell wall biosynthesis
MNPGGLETWLLQVLGHIDRAHFQFDFCICGPDAGIYAKEVENLGGRILLCPRGLGLSSFRSGFKKVLHQGKYDVIHSHVSFFSGLLLRWAEKEGVPIRIAHSHNVHDGRPDTFPRGLYRTIMKSWINLHTTHGLAASKPAADALFVKNWESDQRFHVLHYGLALQPFQKSIDRAEVRAEFGIPFEAPVVGHVGRFDQFKNQGFLVEVANAVLKRRPDVHFLFVGDGALRPAIETTVRRMGISQKVHFAGIRTDVPRLMIGAMDFFVFPSVYEGFGLCLLEAQAAGLQCLVSDAVPNEVIKVPGSVDFLALSLGKDHWSTKIISGLDFSRPKSTSALSCELQDRFSIKESLRELTSVYTARQMPSSPLAPEQHV